MYLLQRLQGIGVHFSDEVGFCTRIVIFSNRVDIHQAVVCDLHSLEVCEKPANIGQKRQIVQQQIAHAMSHQFHTLHLYWTCKSKEHFPCLTNLEKIFLQGSGYANVPNSVITTRFSVMARTYASVLTNLNKKEWKWFSSQNTRKQNIAVRLIVH